MDQTTTVILIVGIVLVIAIAIAVIAAFSRRTRLRSLPPESRAKYASSWQNAESRFFEDPHAAVQDADKIAVMMLTERGATMHDERKVPEDLRHARDAATSDEGREGTEGKRKAMAHYKRLVQDAVGSEMQRRPDDGSRREVAS